jgi:uncharacterized protein YndB with AHSA1/START domain
MLKRFLIILAAAIAALAVVVALQPADFQVTRTGTIAAPPGAVFAQVNDFHKWNDWSPWAKLDPNAKNTFDGPESGVGAGFAWSGNNEVGEGRMTITESVPNERIAMDLIFTKPFAATNKTEFTFRPKGDHTEVTWSMSGRNNFMGKAASLAMNMDKMVGGQFEKGFANLNTVVAAPAKP